ncbi:winged helix-turn-helix transcriptional regulator [Paenibacillus sp. SI8]|uniref:winged helix-turn-helix transcriptional regulator n=1 Tax=unclassified Paenibacillus TaxID=185978 RepID=UPI003466B4E8
MFSTNKGNHPDISLKVCGYSKMLEIISSKWTVLIIYAMEDGRIRFGEMGRRIEGISKKMLTQTLRQLERDGIVTRELTPTIPPSVDYSLTPLGESLLQPMRELNKWAIEKFSVVEQARDRYDQAAEPQNFAENE